MKHGLQDLGFVAGGSDVKDFETNSKKGLRVGAFSEGVVTSLWWWLENLLRE